LVKINQPKIDILFLLLTDSQLEQKITDLSKEINYFLNTQTNKKITFKLDLKEDFLVSENWWNRSVHSCPDLNLAEVYFRLRTSG